MIRKLNSLLLAQFLSAFADNAILFTIIAMVTLNPVTLDQVAPTWYIPALQASFILAFVILAPWVGPFADSWAKPKVLMWATAIKFIGAGLLLTGVEPLLAYGMVGIGAAIYSPAKYGILPELVEHNQLVKANGWVEGSTILAILAGSWLGAKVADQSLNWALLMILALYALSALATFFISPLPPKLAQRPPAALANFKRMSVLLYNNGQARFSLLGTALFWATAAVLRLMLVVWAPLVLLTTTTTQIAELTLFIAIGILFGSLLAPRLIPLERLRRSPYAAFVLGLCIVGLGLSGSEWPARIALLAIGMAGGLFVVPLNAVLQEAGHRTVGSGGAVAVQNFTENLLMLIATGLYLVATKAGITPVPSIIALGVMVLIAILALSRLLGNAAFTHAERTASTRSAVADKQD